ncbi:MAG: transposase [Actinomycetota bacterium]
MLVAHDLEERPLSEKRKYRTFSPDEKAEIVLAGLRGDRSVRDVCREYEIAETLCYQWRDRLLEGGKEALETPKDKGRDPQAEELKEVKKRIARLERALGLKTYDLEVVGELLRDWT